MRKPQFWVFHDSLPHSIPKLLPAKKSKTRDIPLILITFSHQQNKEIKHTIKRVIEGVFFFVYLVFFSESFTIPDEEKKRES
jgi:hypothetical protein